MIIPPAVASVASTAWLSILNGTKPLDAASPDLCGYWTYQGNTSDQSPSTSHCQKLLAKVTKTPRVSWPVKVKTGYITLEQTGKCAFGAKVIAGGNKVKMGRQDIVDILTYSIQNFAQGERIGAYGTGRCQGKDIFIDSEIAWSIMYREVQASILLQ